MKRKRSSAAPHFSSFSGAVVYTCLLCVSASVRTQCCARDRNYKAVVVVLSLFELLSRACCENLRVVEKEKKNNAAD